MKKRLFVSLSLAFVGMLSLIGATATYLSFCPAPSQTEAAITTSELRTAQTKLKRWGYYTGSVDGINGPLTKKAVRYFQSKNGLAVDGIIGPKTAAALGMTLSGSTSSISSSDLNLLARIIYGEARGEPYAGQVAVRCCCDE